MGALLPVEPDPTLAVLLTAPLLATAPGWTSRSLAAQLGTSQSAVARAWSAAYGDAGAADRGDPLGGRLPPSGLRLEGVTVSPHGSRLVLVHERDALPGVPVLPPGPFMRSARRPPLQALLAADLLAAARPARRGGPDLEPPAGPADRRARYVVGSRRAAGRGVPRGVDVVVEGALGWQALLEPLVRRADATPPADLLDLQLRLMEWARGDHPAFAWTAGARAAAPAGRRDPVPWPRSTSQVVADDVVGVLLGRIEDGRLAGGERVTEADLARAVRTSRAHVRDAVRLLAAAGLVDLEPGRGVVVPTPTVADVVETYAARRALGTVVVRYAVRSSAADLEPASGALREMLAVARTGDAHTTGEADLRFQDVLAAATGLRRVPALFRTLTDQLRLSIAVMGLDYSYSIPGMCRDDEILMERVLARDERGAVEAWQRKVDDALAYMTTQLGRWSRHQPRARHSASAGRSRPSVVSSPWPG